MRAQSLALYIQKVASGAAHTHHFLEMYLLLAIVSIELSKKGMRRVLQRCTSPGPLEAMCSESEEARLVELARMLSNQASRAHFLENACMERALATCWFLRRRGVKADFVLAVRKRPFSGHAWAEWRGRRLDDPLPGEIRICTPILRR